MGSREASFVRAVIEDGSWRKAAEAAGLEEERARRFLEGIARFASTVPTGMQFGLEESAGPSAHRSEVERQSGIEQVVVCTDGASIGNPGPAGAGGVISAPSGERLDEFSVPLGHATNNIAEYEAVRIGLERAIRLGARRVVLKLDSELVANQLTGRYRVKNPGLVEAYLRVTELLNRLDGIDVRAIPREENTEADRRAQTAARTGAADAG